MGEPLRPTKCRASPHHARNSLRQTSTALVALLCLAGCYRSHQRSDGSDAGPPERACGLSADAAMRAMVITQACERTRRDGWTVRSLMDAWEVGALGDHLWPLEASPPDPVSPPPTSARNCDYWRCAAEASSCAEATGACEDAQFLPSATIACLFDYGVDSCEREGRYLVRCWGSPARDADHNWIRTLDCEAYGATCVDGACELGDCRFGANDEGATCTGDTVALCGGRVVLASCGSSCGAASLPGEVSTSWCGPSVTVGSAAPADCDGTTLRFTTVAGRDVVFDCVAAGYASCDVAGCVP